MKNSKTNPPLQREHASNNKNNEINTNYEYHDHMILKVWDCFIRDNMKLQFFCMDAEDKNGSFEPSLFTGTDEMRIDKKAGLLINNDGKLYYNKDNYAVLICQAVDYANKTKTTKENAITSSIEAAFTLVEHWKKNNNLSSEIQYIILFPYHANVIHWNIGVIKCKNHNTSLTIYEPLYKDEKIREDIKNAIDEVVKKNGLQFKYKVTCTQQQKDGTSCGAISAENGKDIIEGTHERLNKSYEAGAYQLRKSHVDEVKNERFSEIQSKNEIFTDPEKKISADINIIIENFKKFLKDLPQENRGEFSQILRDFHLDDHCNPSKEILDKIKKEFANYREVLNRYPINQRLNLFSCFFTYKDVTKEVEWKENAFDNLKKVVEELEAVQTKSTLRQIDNKSYSMAYTPAIYYGISKTSFVNSIIGNWLSVLAIINPLVDSASEGADFYFGKNASKIIKLIVNIIIKVVASGMSFIREMGWLTLWGRQTEIAKIYKDYTLILMPNGTTLDDMNKIIEKFHNENKDRKLIILYKSKTSKKISDKINNVFALNINDIDTLDKNKSFKEILKTLPIPRKGQTYKEIKLTFDIAFAIDTLDDQNLISLPSKTKEELDTEITEWKRRNHIAGDVLFIPPSDREQKWEAYLYKSECDLEISCPDNEGEYQKTLNEWTDKHKNGDVLFIRHPDDQTWRAYLLVNERKGVRKVAPEDEINKIVRDLGLSDYKPHWRYKLHWHRTKSAIKEQIKNEYLRPSILFTESIPENSSFQKIIHQLIEKDSSCERALISKDYNRLIMLLKSGRVFKDYLQIRSNEFLVPILKKTLEVVCGPTANYQRDFLYRLLGFLQLLFNIISFTYDYAKYYGNEQHVSEYENLSFLYVSLGLAVIAFREFIYKAVAEKENLDKEESKKASEVHKKTALAKGLIPPKPEEPEREETVYFRYF